MSATPSPSGDTTGTAGWTKTPVYWNTSAVAIGRSRPSDGRLSSLPSNAIVVEPPPSSAIAGDRAETDERLRELEVRQADAVAGLAPVDGDEDDAAVGELADRRCAARAARAGSS